MTDPLSRLMSQISQAESRLSQTREEFEINRGKIRGEARLTADTRERVSARLVRAARMVNAPDEPAADAIAFERILGRSDLLNVNFFEIGVLRARAVGRIVIRQGSRVSGFGTGFMISPRLLLTNHHVLSEPSEAESSTVEFDFALGPDGLPRAVASFPLRPGEFFHADESLDFACVAVAEAADGIPLSRFGFTRASEEMGKVMVGESLNIIQHPGGEMKQIACRENDLITVLPNFLHYRTDTAPGSSGSPVFSDMWELVALHHAGTPKRNAAGQILAIGGAVWTSAMGESRIDWIANEGTRISRILARLRGVPGLSATQRTLRDGIFNAKPGPLEIADQAVAVPAGGAALAASPDGTVTWTIPLRVSIHLGAPHANAAAIPQPPAPPTSPLLPAPPAGVPGAAVPSTGTGNDERQIDRSGALRLLDEGSRAEYYNEQRDTAQARDYYAGVTPGNGAELFRRLHDLLERTHTSQPRYRPAVHLYPLVDLQPPGGDGPQLRSLYTGQLFAASAFIHEDFETEAARERLAEELAASGIERAGVDEISLLEASHPFNCEHVVPQSWFQRREPMRGDLHHLFACESRCNSFRQNTPFFDFPDFEEAVRTGCGKSEGTRFEPSMGKGEAARATLYFLLRYPEVATSGDGRNLLSRLSVLLRWHAAFPVSLYEKHRNMAIFQAQGNRNPLIDHPEWAQQIDFVRGASPLN